MLKLVTALALSLVINTTAHAMELEKAAACPSPDFSSINQSQEFQIGYQVLGQLAQDPKLNMNLEEVLNATYEILVEKASDCEALNSSVVSYYSDLFSTTYTAYNDVQSGKITYEAAVENIKKQLSSVVQASSN